MKPADVDEATSTLDKKIPGNAVLSLTPAFYRIRDVLRITALSRPTLYRRIAARRFPPPVRLGGRACGWPAAALQAWIDDPDGYRAPPPAGEDVRRGPGRPRKYLPTA